MTALRVAVVGPGGWGRQHTRIFNDRSDTELVAVVGRDPGRTAERAKALGTNGHVSIAAMLESEQPDLVTVCLPNEGYCSRPCVRTPRRRCRRVRDAARSSSLTPASSPSSRDAAWGRLRTRPHDHRRRAARRRRAVTMRVSTPRPRLSACLLQ
jgi:hypothetical protein